jgi:hypothetical protein
MSQVTRIDAFFLGGRCFILNDLNRRHFTLSRSEGEQMLATMRAVAPRFEKPITFKRHHGLPPMTRRSVACEVSP